MKMKYNMLYTLLTLKTPWVMNAAIASMHKKTEDGKPLYDLSLSVFERRFRKYWEPVDDPDVARYSDFTKEDIKKTHEIIGHLLEDTELDTDILFAKDQPITDCDLYTAVLGDEDDETENHAKALDMIRERLGELAEDCESDEQLIDVFRPVVIQGLRWDFQHEYIPLTEYARMHGKDERSVRTKAASGNFKTAKKVGFMWFIDKDEPFADARLKSGKYRGKYKSKVKKEEKD